MPTSAQFAAATRLLRERLPDLKAIYLHGSIARGESRERSDVDIAVLGTRPLEPLMRLELSAELAGLLGRDVDLADLTHADTVFRSQVVCSGKRLYCRDENACEAFENRVFASYAYLNEERRDILEDIQRRGHVHG